MKERYKKPYIEEIGAPREAWFHYAGAVNEPVFPYFVMDGGAFLFMNDRLGIADGDQLLEKVMDGSFFALWQKAGLTGTRCSACPPRIRCAILNGIFSCSGCIF